MYRPATAELSNDRHLNRPARVLHVLGALNRGGVETWLMHLLRHFDREIVAMDFLVHSEEPGAYDDEALALGARVLCCPHTRDLLTYRRHFLEIARRYGPFDVVHSHVHNFSGYVLGLGREAQIPVRISHSHNDTRFLDKAASLRRKAYLAATRELIFANCTKALAASELAARALFGSRCRTDDRVEIVLYGIDPSPFHETCDRRAVRAEFGFQPSDIVFGHVGRFDPQKNHPFLVQIAAELAKLEANARFLLVGCGPLREAIELEFRAAGLGGRTLFTGPRADVPRLMLAVMDAFIFPSLYEGLGLVIVEAQAAGLPAIISDAVPAEAVVSRQAVKQHSLQEPPSMWAEAALKQSRSRFPNALRDVERSGFSLEACLRTMGRIYRGDSVEKYANPQ